MKTIRTDDTFLAGFLRARKHNVDKAFKMVRMSMNEGLYLTSLSSMYAGVA